jgi:hypothetical protein
MPRDREGHAQRLRLVEGVRTPPIAVEPTPSSLEAGSTLQTRHRMFGHAFPPVDWL